MKDGRLGGRVPPSGGTLRVGLLQFAPRLRDVAANRTRILDARSDAGVDLLLTPELSLTGYHVEDDAAGLAVPVRRGHPLAGWQESGPGGQGDGGLLVLGLVERGADGTPLNAMVGVRGDRVAFVHRKVYLPTYGMFDEGRFFGRGSRVRAFSVGGGWRVGPLVCEDFWHPALSYLLAAAGANVLLVQSAAAGRGLPGDGGARFTSWDSWVGIARTTAEVLGVYVLLANRVGVEGGLTFAGGSLVVGPDGTLLARAGEGEELIRAELRLEEVARARQPYAHSRDDDPHLTLRELARIVRGRR